MENLVCLKRRNPIEMKNENISDKRLSSKIKAVLLTQEEVEIRLELLRESFQKKI